MRCPEAQCTCPACGARLVKIGEETSEQLDYQPASLFVTEHVRFKYACKACEEPRGHERDARAAHRQGPPGPRAAGPGDHGQVRRPRAAEPPGRHLRAARRRRSPGRRCATGWPTPRALLEPLYRDLKGARARRQGRADRRHDGAGAGSRPHHDPRRPAVGVRGRHEARPTSSTTTRRDAQSRGAARLSRGLPRLSPGGCLRRLRRALRHGRGWWRSVAGRTRGGTSGTPRRPTRRARCWRWASSSSCIGWRREAKDLEPRRAGCARGQQSRPAHAERFKGWLDEQADVVLPKSPIGEAVHYARAQWAALTRYLDDGDLAIDNNASERALRRVSYGPEELALLRQRRRRQRARSCTASWRRARRTRSMCGRT